MLEIPDGWSLEQDDEEEPPRLVRELELRDFMACVEAVNEIARVAERFDHHPDVYIESYNLLTIATYTHTEDDVTEADTKLARAIDERLREQGIGD